MNIGRKSRPTHEGEVPGRSVSRKYCILLGVAKLLKRCGVIVFSISSFS